MEKFKMDSICYGRGVRQIKNCAFSTKDTSDKFVSKKNKGNSSNQKLSVLSNKIVDALFDAHEYGFNIFHGVKGKNEYFLGTFDRGSVSGPNYIGIILKVIS